MSPPQASRIVIKKYIPSGAPKVSDFTIESVPAPSADKLKDNEVIVRPLYLSIDPYQRGRMSGATNSYVPSYDLDQPLTNFAVAEVSASASKDLSKGDTVLINDGKWQTEFVANAKDIIKVDVDNGLEARDYVGVLSMPAFTAYYSTVTLGKPKAGETILVSSASGAVGQIVVQIAKAKGLRVVGVAGSDEKVEYVKSLGADTAFNYKTCGDFTKAIKNAAPEGVDIYFDNVGGEFLDAALINLNDYARVVICGAISQYNASSPADVYRIGNFTNILVRKVTVTGFIILDHLNTPDQKEFIREMSELYKQGKIKYRVTETNGFDNAPQALVDLFDGKNFGKSVVKV